MSYFQYESEFKALVDMLRVIVTGGTSDSVDTDSGTKPSIAKHLADNLRDYVRAANDRKGVANKAILDANLAFDDGALVEVTNDATDTNNGLYRKEGASGTGSWVKAATDKYTYLQSLFDGMNLHVQNELEKINIFNFDPETKLATDSGEEVVFSLNDLLGFAVLLVDTIGRVEINGVQFDRTDGLNELEILDDAGRLALAIGKAGELLHNGVEAKSTDDIPFEYAITDLMGRLAFAIGEKGNVVLPGMDIELNADIPGYSFVLTDEAGRIALGVETDGKVRFIPSTNLVASTEGRELPLSEQVLLSDDMQFFSYGQSLSRGATAQPVITTSQPYNNVTFQAGVLCRDADAYDLTSFKPLVEAILNGEGETPVSAALNTASARFGSEYSDNNLRFIGSAPGRGGTPIDALNRGNVDYNNLLTQVRSAYDISQAEGRTHSVHAIFWSHGESNYFGSDFMQREVYHRKEVELYEHLSLDIQGITGQKFSPIMIGYQLAAHRRMQRDYPEIALAKLDSANEKAGIFIAAPMYFADYNTDNLHLTSEGSEWLGKYYGKVYSKVIHEGVDWKPVSPKSIVKQGRLIEVQFHLPEGGALTFDTDWVAAAPNMGFDIYDQLKGNLLDIISNVELSGPSRVRITLSQSLPTSARLTYAHGRVGDPAEANRLTGPRGNLRDNAGDTDTYTDHSGTERPMHNWCVIFDEEI